MKSNLHELTNYLFIYLNARETKKSHKGTNVAGHKCSRTHVIMRAHSYDPPPPTKTLQ